MINKITTTRGDKGETDFKGKRVQKGDLSLELIGTMDELSSFIGLCKATIKEEKMHNELDTIQTHLQTIMGQLSGYGKPMESSVINYLNELIGVYKELIPGNHGFVHVGESIESSHLDIARTMARKCERLYHRVGEHTCEVSTYLNRLSDVLYVMARFQEQVSKMTAMVLQEKGIDCSSMNKVNLQLVKKVLQDMESFAKTKGLNLVLAIANGHGHIIGVHVMDGAITASYDLAVHKAYTATSFKMTTRQLGELAQPGKSLFGIGEGDARIITFPGGLPLDYKDCIVAGIGVSGASADDDEKVALYGMNKMKDYLEGRY